MAKKILLLVLLAVLAGPSRAADPLSGGIGARPVALGSAYAGFAEDAFSIFTNPSGLAEIKERNFSSTYSQPVSLITFTSLSGVFPNIWGGTFALAYRNRTLSNMLVSQETADYTDQDLILCFAKKIRNDLALGGNYRIISRGLSKEVPGYESQNGSGGALDLGIKYLPHPWLNVGLALQNLGGKVDNQDGSQSEISAKTTLGISFKIGGDEACFKNIKQQMHLNFDIGKIADEPNSRLHLGYEWWPVEAFALRLGFDQSPKSKTENYTHPTAGLGINYRGITFDYAFRKLTDTSELIEHYFSLGYVGITEERKAAPIKEKVELMHFKDVPENHWAREPIEYLTTIRILNWYEDGTFRPQQPVSRAELIMFLVRAKDYPLPKETKQVFADVPADFWAAGYIQVAFEKRLISVSPDKNLKPRELVSRAEVLTAMAYFESVPLKGKNLQLEQNITRAELAKILFGTPSIKQRIRDFLGREAEP